MKPLLSNHNQNIQFRYVLKIGNKVEKETKRGRAFQSFGFNLLKKQKCNRYREEKGLS